MEWKKHFSLVLGLVALMWVVHIVGVVVPVDQFGIRPRSLMGLIGIGTSPFLHASWGHLIANTMGMLTFGGILVFTHKEEESVGLLLMMILLSGALTWLIGRSANHIGASGLIFAMFGYLLLHGWFKRDKKTMITSLIMLVGFGGTIFGVLPVNPGVSWEGHLSGFIAGGLLAKIRV